MEITLMSRCKNMCSYCPQSLFASQYGPVEYMTMETFVTCLNKIPKHIDILFAGFSEPFLNPEASLMIKYAVDAEYKVQLLTTLVNITEQDINKLNGLDIDIMLHLPDNNNDTKIVVDDQYITNLKHFTKVMSRWHAISFKSLHHKLQNQIKCNVLHERVLHNRANNLDFITNERLTGPIHCNIIKLFNEKQYNHNVLLPNGNVVLCCMDFGLKHILGNLLHCSYEELFTSKEYQKLIQGLNNDTLDILCRTCHEARKDDSNK